MDETHHVYLQASNLSEDAMCSNVGGLLEFGFGSPPEAHMLKL
jgi:hypothetical protein